MPIHGHVRRSVKLGLVLLGLTILVCLTAVHLFTGFGVRYTETEPISYPSRLPVS